MCFIQIRNPCLKLWQSSEKSSPFNSVNPFIRQAIDLHKIKCIDRNCMHNDKASHFSFHGDQHQCLSTIWLYPIFAKSIFHSLSRSYLVIPLLFFKFFFVGSFYNKNEKPVGLRMCPWIYVCIIEVVLLSRCVCVCICVRIRLGPSKWISNSVFRTI